MTNSPSVLVAFAAGFVSFVSPCCLPLVPGYLATVTGVAPDQTSRRVDRKVVINSLLFVASFSAVFILLGLSATALGGFLFENQLTLRKLSGVAIALMGLLFIGSVFYLRLNFDWRPRGLIERAGRGGPVLVGLAFAIAWTPCVGPALGAILGLASGGGSIGQGAALLAVYSAGLALPFLAVAVGFNAAQRVFSWFKRHFALIQVAAGAVLVTMGVLVFTNQLFRLNIEIQQALDGWGLNFFQQI